MAGFVRVGFIPLGIRRRVRGGKGAFAQGPGRGGRGGRQGERRLSLRDCYEMCYRFDTETGRIPATRLTPIAELIPENRNFCQRHDFYQPLIRRAL
jgi:hypothetical protein